MPPPTPLKTATSSLTRLLKEEKSYHSELESQIARLATTRKSTDENVEYSIRQEETAIEETKKVFPVLRSRIEEAVEKLEALIERGGGEEEEVKGAEDAVRSAREALKTPL